MQTLPRGTVTFVSTDIEGSTRLAHGLGASFGDVIEAHHRHLRAAFADGVVLSTQGDSFFVAFGSATNALEGAVDAQRRIAGEPWPDGFELRVRIGLHTGEPELGGDNYVGADPARAARIGAAAHGGQIVLSESTRSLVEHELPAGVSIRPLGVHRLRGFPEPGPLYQLVVRGLRSDFPPLSSLVELHTNLPADVTSFIGREDEVAQLEGLVSNARLVTLIGTGGTGKTRLAIHLARRLLPRHADGVWLAELAPVADDELVPIAVARGLGIRDEPGRPVTDSILDYLRGKELLLLVDNCEHVLLAAGQLVERLLGGAPNVVVVASSREALGVSGETLFQVPSLALPSGDWSPDAHDPHLDLSRVLASEAVRLFADRAGAVSPGFELTTHNAAAVIEICRRLDGIPLAIELAAARVTHLSPAEIAARLDDRFRLLTGGRRTVLPRQQTLQALIDWSWRLLDEPDQALLRSLSVFSGGWSLEAATAVTADPDGIATLDGLGRLVSRSLLVVDRPAAGGHTRYHLLETIRQYARDRLDETDEVVTLRDRHLDWFLALAERAEPGLMGPQMAGWLQTLDEDADNLRAALEWALDTDVYRATRLAIALTLYWRSRSPLEGFEQHRRAVGLMDRLAESGQAAHRDAAPTADERERLATRLLSLAAMSAWLTGNAHQGVGWARDAKRRSEQLADPEIRAEAITALAEVLVFTGGDPELEELGTEAGRLARGAGSWWLLGFIEAGMAQWYVEHDEPRATEVHLARAAEAAARSGNPLLLAFTALTRGRVAAMSGHTVEARADFLEAITGYEAVGDRGLALVARSELGHALRMGGRMDEAASIYLDTLHGWLHAGNRGAIANQLESVAFIAVSRERWGDAARLLGAAEAIRTDARATLLPFEEVALQAAVAALRANAPAVDVDAAWLQGSRLSVDDAAALAYEVLAG